MALSWIILALKFPNAVHYYFCMRALKSVHDINGESKRRSPDLNEDIILIRAIKDLIARLQISTVYTTSSLEMGRTDLLERCPGK